MLKKKHIINLAAERLEISVARNAAGAHVQVAGGKLSPVDYRAVLAGKAVSLVIKGQMHLVHLSAVGPGGQLMATINGRPVPLTAMDELSALSLDAQATGPGNGVVAADIPGLVVELKVSEGQMVAQGDPVIVIEAMKMQNELTAGIAGVVTKIVVKTGQSVYPNDILLIIGQPEAEKAES